MAEENIKLKEQIGMGSGMAREKRDKVKGILKEVMKIFGKDFTYIAKNSEMEDECASPP